MVGGDMSPLVMRVHSKPNGVQWLDYRKAKLTFLEGLSDEVRAAVIYKGYYTGALKDEDYLLAKFRDLKICRHDFSPGISFSPFGHSRSSDNYVA